MNDENPPFWLGKSGELREAWHNRPDLRELMNHYYSGVRHQIDRINSINDSEKRACAAHSYMKLIDERHISSASSFSGLPTRNRFVYALLLDKFPGCDREVVEYGHKDINNPYGNMFSQISRPTWGQESLKLVFKHQSLELLELIASVDYA